jgi:hypothetical protein
MKCQDLTKSTLLQTAAAIAQSVDNFLVSPSLDFSNDFFSVLGLVCAPLNQYNTVCILNPPCEIFDQSFWFWKTYSEQLFNQ